MYKLVFVFMAICVVIAWAPAYAQGNEPSIPDAPAEGVYILDTLNWLTAEQEERITTIASRLDKAGLAVIAVVTLDDCSDNKLQFRLDLFYSWGIGHPDKDGLLILACWYDGDKSRRSVEQQYGAGLGNILSGKITDQIAQEEFVPAFQQDHPGEGLVDMVVKYNTVIRKGPVTSNPSSASSSNTGLYIIIIIIALLLGLVQKQFGLVSNSDRDTYWEKDPNSGGRDRNSRARDRDSSDGGGGSSTKF